MGFGINPESMARGIVCPVPHRVVVVRERAFEVCATLSVPPEGVRPLRLRPAIVIGFSSWLRLRKDEILRLGWKLRGLNDYEWSKLLP